MFVSNVFETSSPLSSSTTLSSPPSPLLKSTPQQNVYHNPRIQASDIIEFTASRAISSSTVYVYDLAEQAGFGTLTKFWSKSGEDTASVVELQTRAGAGLSLVGRLSEGTNQDTVNGAVLTAYTTPTGLCMMAPALSYLPSATPTSRLVIQVPTISAVGETFFLSPSLAPLTTALAILPVDVVVLLSATPQESVDFAALSYRLKNSHVIHLFDHHSCSREIGHSIAPLPHKAEEDLTISEIISQAGYTFFDYAGDIEAHTVMVLLNGPLALTAKALASRIHDVGVVAVKVLRPWDETTFRGILPTTVKTVHVLVDVPNASSQGSLYVDVFGSLLQSSAGFSVHAHHITPFLAQQYLSKQKLFIHFLIGIVRPVLDPLPSFDSLNLKKLLLFSSPKSPLSSLSRIVEDIFLSDSAISARLLIDHDVFSKPGGITAHRILLSPKGNTDDHIPIPIALPFDANSDGEADFLGVLDHSLLRSHSIIKYAKPGCAVLVVTDWSAAELFSNLPSEVVSLILERALRFFIIDAKDLASALVGTAGPTHDAIQNLLVHLAFLRLYLGNAAQKSLVLKVAQVVFDDVIQGIELAKINSHAWSGLSEVDIPPSSESAAPETPINVAPPLKEFEFNAIAVETDNEETVVNGARLSSWHDAAKHLIFPAVFTPPTVLSIDSDEFPQNLALRPEVPDRTFLVTCTVNHRLTPLDYDRNVFHLEFDTNGTGLKYAIGEALGVHGWNDSQEVLDFCEWYGVDPDRLVTIPVVADGEKMHTRTVLQTLQQQVDLFGRPPKSFYTDLAAHATDPVDKHALQFIGSPEGSATFKKLSEKDTVNFADVLRRFESAKPGIETLCGMVGDIKPRHYSIASAQSVVGNRVDLLVVTVDWVTPSGEFTPTFPH
jgi:sulfite reductase (NADPH) flavoprotein alpha-component